MKHLQSVLIAIMGLMCLALSACGTTGHVAMLHDFADDAQTQGQNPVCTLEVFKPIDERISLRYLHQSWCFTGKPFNDNPESTLDAVGVDLKVW